MIISYLPDFPFDIYLSLQDITRHPFGLTEQLDGDTYCTIIQGKYVTIFQEKTTQKLTIDVKDCSPNEKLSVLSETKRKFGLNQDMNAFYHFAEKDRNLAPVVDRLKGLTMLQKSTSFEMLVTAIADQQLNVSFATKLKQKFIIEYGLKQTCNGIDLWTFPTPQRIAELSEDSLRHLKFSGSKSRYIVQLARNIVNGSYSLEKWSELSDEDLISSLMSIYGVGRWTAEYSAMVGFNRKDIVPAADIGLMRAVQQCYHLHHRPMEEEVREIGESWRPWRSLVTYYLWYAYE